MPRWLLTLCIIVLFGGAARLYTWALTPVIARQAPPRPLTMRTAGAPPTPHAASSAAREHLGHADWAAEAPIVWQRGEQAYLFADDYEVVDDTERNKVRFAPFALIWRDERHPEQTPYVMSAAAARLTFQNRFELSGADPGRIVGAALEGEVYVRGPNGLVLDGASFNFSEQTRTLYSDEPLRFAYGPTADSPSRASGSARGFSLLLVPGVGELLGDGLPQIADFERLTLRSDVRCEMQYEQDGRPTPVLISCDGAFEFDRTDRIASFDRNVIVVHREGRDDAASTKNVLRCPRLELRFDEDPQAGRALADGDGPGGVVPASAENASVWSQKMRSLASLKFHYLVATAPSPRRGEPQERVNFTSQGFGVTANAQTLQFDAFQRLLALTDPEAGVVDYGPTRLLAKRLMLGLDERQQLAWALGEGRGRIEHSDAATGELVLTADWRRRMEYRPDPEPASQEAADDRVIDLNGDVQVVLGELGALTTQRLRLWVPVAAVSRLASTSEPTTAPEGLPVRRIRADGGVLFDGPAAAGKAATLDVSLTAGRPPVIATAEDNSPRDEGSRGDRDKLSVPWVLQAGRITAEVIVDPETMDAGPRSVIAEDNLRIERAASEKKGAAGDALLMTGQRLTLTNLGGEQQVATLWGGRKAGSERAHFHSGELHLEGPEIQVDRAATRVQVIGRSLLQLPARADLLGRQMDAALRVDITSLDGLTFDGRRATFTRDVVVKLDQSRLHCQELIAVMDRPVSFRDESAAAPPEIQTLECRERVTINMHEFNKSQLVRHLEANVGRCLIDLKSGEFTADGEGRVDEWRKGGMQLSLTPQPTASANRPAESRELPWTYAHLQFKGNVKGNIHQQYAEISERVTAIYAPVEKANVPFERQDLSRTSASSERAACMQCDVLKILLTDSQQADRPFLVSLEAEGRSVLEGRSVHANAHQMSYEQAKDLLTLRGRGTEKASVYFEPESGARERYSASGGTIEVKPASRSVKVVGAGSFNGAH
ncbi:MAG: hypothetical protein KF774_20535 [Planctomyces sp.]|nr:hypothetical protein [Planctomyces sp.]